MEKKLNTSLSESFLVVEGHQELSQTRRDLRDIGGIAPRESSLLPLGFPIDTKYFTTPEGTS